MEVYIVTQGVYSDYHIAKVFLDKAKAEKFVEVHNTCTDDDDYMIETFDTNDDDFSLKDELKTFYHCCIVLENEASHKSGEIIELGTYQELCKQDKNVVISRDFSRPYHISRLNYLFVSSTKSMEHAKKIAIEQYQIYTQNKLKSEE